MISGETLLFTLHISVAEHITQTAQPAQQSKERNTYKMKS